MNHICGAVIEFKSALETPAVFIRCSLARNHPPVPGHYGKGLKGVEVRWTDAQD